MDRKAFNTHILLIYLSGLLSSAVVLGLVYFFQVVFQFNLMGLYLLIIPAGAIGAGIIAGLGYSLSSNFLHVRPSAAMVTSVFIISFLVYIGAYYILYYMSDGAASGMSFLSFFKALAENSSLTIGKSSRVTIESISFLGYVFLLLEFAGFVLGAGLPINYMRKKDYCEKCQYFLKPKGSIYVLPELAVTELPEVSIEEKQKIIEKNNEILKTEFERIKLLLKGKLLSENEKTLKEISEQGKSRNYFYLVFSFIACPKCEKHSIYTTLYSASTEKYQITTQQLETIEN